MTDPRFSEADSEATSATPSEPSSNSESAEKRNSSPDGDPDSESAVVAASDDPDAHGSSNSEASALTEEAKPPQIEPNGPLSDAAANPPDSTSAEQPTVDTTANDVPNEQSAAVPAADSGERDPERPAPPATPDMDARVDGNDESCAASTEPTEPGSSADEASAPADAQPAASNVGDKPSNVSGPGDDGEAAEPSAESPVLTSFEEFGLSEQVASNIAGMGWEKPTEVQGRSFTTISQGRDVMVQSHTGSGKTGAFCLPWIANRWDPRPVQENRAPVSRHSPDA